MAAICGYPHRSTHIRHQVPPMGLTKSVKVFDQIIQFRPLQLHRVSHRNLPEDRLHPGRITSPMTGLLILRKR